MNQQASPTFNLRHDTLHNRLSERARIYLTMLAMRSPFCWDIAAAPADVFNAMACDWPMIEGWEHDASALQCEIKTLTHSLLKAYSDNPLRLAINVAEAPQAPLPMPDSAAIHAVYDSIHGTRMARSYNESEVPFDPSLEDVPVGMTVLCQLAHKVEDIRPVGLGAPPTVVFPRSDRQLQRIPNANVAERSKNLPPISSQDLSPTLDGQPIVILRS